MTIGLHQVTSRMAENTLLSVRFIPVTKYVIINHKFFNNLQIIDTTFRTDL